ncbi:T9SS type A sorting domain-containing protein [Flavobacterium sp. U410]
MKKITQLFLLFLTTISFSQAEDVIDPLNGTPTGFLLVGNELYYSHDNSISKIDISVTNPSPVNIINGLDEPTGLLLSGNDLYFTQATENKVSKIDITSPTPSVVDVVTGLNEPAFLALSGNDLYISELGDGKISKVDITASLPTTTTDVVSGLNTPLGIVLNGNDLYIAEVLANKVSKIDITDPSPIAVDVATGLNKPLQLAITGSDLYVTEPDGNKISKVDITASLPTTATDVLTGLGSPEVLVVNATDLYFSADSSVGAGYKIAKLNFAALSTESFQDNSLRVYPNPFENQLFLSTHNVIDYELYDLTGKQLKQGKMIMNSINLAEIPSGIYMLKIKGDGLQQNFKVIKR